LPFLAEVVAEVVAAEEVEEMLLPVMMLLQLQKRLRRKKRRKWISVAAWICLVETKVEEEAVAIIRGNLRSPPPSLNV
jgi:hypothetical protein